MNPIPETTYVLDLAREIEEQRAEVNKLTKHLSDLEAKWAALFSKQSEPKSGQRGGRKAGPNAPSSKVRKTINGDPTRKWTAEGIAGYAHLPVDQVRKTLYNLTVAGQIKRVDRGQYAANSYGQSNGTGALPGAAIQ